MVGGPEDGRGRGELAATVPGEGRAVPLEVGQCGRDHLALLTEGAGEDVHLVAARHVVRDGDPGRQGLVVGVGVDEEQPGRARPGHDVVEEALHETTAMSANSTTPPRTLFADRLRTSDPAT